MSVNGEDHKKERYKADDFLSEEVRDILSYTPHWIVRYGIASIFFCISMVLALCWVIEYPDVIKAQVTITSTNPPSKIIARSDGKVELMVRDNQPVAKGDVIGSVESPANVENVLTLIALLDRKDTDSFEIVDMASQQVPNLGTMQDVFQAYIRSLKLYHTFIQRQEFHRQIAIAKSRLASYEQLGKSIDNQLKLKKEEFIIATVNYGIDSTLYHQKVTSKTEFLAQQTRFLQEKRNIEQLIEKHLSNEIQRSSLESLIEQLVQDHKRETDRLTSDIDLAFNQLLSQLEVWKNKYLLIADTQGLISFSSIWNDNQYVKSGEEILTIVPTTSRPFGRVQLPISGSGKVKEGQRVNIRLDNYPFHEFGILVGEIETKSLVSKDDRYVLIVKLENGLTSTYGSRLEFESELNGTAEIVTNNLRIIHRIFNQLRALVQSKSDS